MARTVTIDIETAIRKLSWATAQVGQKSLQKITVDFDLKTVAMTYLTGTTKILRFELGSARDAFSVVKPRFSGGGVAFFSASGETASSVRVMPNINYDFDFEVSETEITFSGSHDGYPSYNISVNGRSVYDYVQGHLGQLAGSSDVTVARKTVPIP